MKKYEKCNVVEIDLKEMIVAVLKKAWLICIVAVLCAIAAFVYTKASYVEKYESSGSILIMNQKEEAGDSTQLSVSTKLTDDYEAVIKSRTIVNQMIENLDLDDSYEDVIDKISTSNGSDSRVVKVIVRDTDPEFTEKVVNELLELSVEYIDENLEVHQVMILDKGFLPEEPTGGMSKKLVVVAFAMGACIPVGIIVVMMVMDDTIKKEEHVEQFLQTMVLGEVVCGNKKELYEKIRTNIKAQNVSAKSIVLTSTNEITGIDKIATEIAASFARNGRKTLFIDADLRKGQDEVAKEQVKGLSEVLCGEKKIGEVCILGTIDDMYVLPSGTPSEKVSELLDSSKFEEVLNTVSAEYDMIIINASSMEKYIDAAIVAKYCDNVIMVVEYGKTDYHMAQKAMKQLDYVGASVLGCIISK